MCVVSAMGDRYSDLWREPLKPYIHPNSGTGPELYKSQVSREEFEALKAQVEEMLEILKVAKLYDEENGEPDCEMDDKVEILKKVAELVGVDLEEVFG